MGIWFWEFSVSWGVNHHCLTFLFSFKNNFLWATVAEMFTIDFHSFNVATPVHICHHLCPQFPSNTPYSSYPPQSVSILSTLIPMVHDPSHQSGSLNKLQGQFVIMWIRISCAGWVIIVHHILVQGNWVEWSHRLFHQCLIGPLAFTGSGNGNGDHFYLWRGWDLIF